MVQLQVALSKENIVILKGSMYNVRSRNMKYIFRNILIITANVYVITTRLIFVFDPRPTIKLFKDLKNDLNK